MPGKKITDLDIYDDINTDKSKRDLFEVSKNTGTYASPTYATDGSRKISVEQLKETLFIKEINSYKSVTTSSPTFDKQAYNGIGNSGTYTLPTSTGKYEVLAIIIEGSLSVTVTGLGGGYGDLVFTNQNETAYLIDTIYGWYPLAINKEVNSSAFELLANKATSILGNETDTTKYTNTKAVADYITFFYTNGVIPAIEGHIVDLESHPNSLIYAPTTLSTTTALALKANANSPTFTGTPSGPTATAGTNTTQFATTAFVTTAIGAIPTPTLDTVTGAGNTTTNSIEVGGLVVDMPSGLGVAVEITKGGAGEALTVNKTSGSGNVASFNNGTTLVKDLEVSTATANRPTFFDSSKKLVIATGALLGTWFQTLTEKSTPVDADTIIVNDSASSFEAKITTLTELWTNYLLSKVQALGYLSGTITNNTIPKGNGSGGLVNSSITDDGTTVTISGNVIVSGLTTGSAITGGTVNANNILRTPVLATDTVTVLNGSIWYNTFTNLFKGFVNGIVVTFMTSRMPANTVKTNNTGSTADAVDLALTTETVLGRTASVNSGNIAPIPLQASISAETTLVAGTRTITDSRVTANTIVMVSPSNTGTLTQQIRYAKTVGTSVVFTAGASDTCTFSYWIIF